MFSKTLRVCDLDVADADRPAVLVGADLTADEHQIADAPALRERHRHGPLPVPFGHQALATLEHMRPTSDPRARSLEVGDATLSRARYQYRVPDGLLAAGST